MVAERCLAFVVRAVPHRRRAGLRKLLSNTLQTYKKFPRPWSLLFSTCSTFSYRFRVVLSLRVIRSRSIDLCPAPNAPSHSPRDE